MSATRQPQRPELLVRAQRFIVRQGKARPLLRNPVAELLAAVPGLFNLLVGAIGGQWWQMFHSGKAPAPYLREARERAKDFEGTISLAKIDSQVKDPDVIEAKIRQVIGAIDGFDFLDQKPAGRDDNKHVILLKPGVNWGLLRYPTVTSWQSVYAVTKMCLEEAAERGAAAEVIVGEESGIEMKLWGGSTEDNLKHTHILYAAVLAGLEQAADQEHEEEKFRGAGELLEKVRLGEEAFIQFDDGYRAWMRHMAERAGVSVLSFDRVERQAAHFPEAVHYRAGMSFPRMVAEKVTDIINLPKPPGRHMIMGNTGLSGALKNHIGLLEGEARSPGLHELDERYPACRSCPDYESRRQKLLQRHQAMADHPQGRAARKLAIELLFLTREFPLQAEFQEGEGDSRLQRFHEKVAELYGAVKSKERFSLADMRQTMSSLGPDLGDTMPIGAVLAARDPVTLDVVAGALLKRAYAKTKSAMQALEPGGDTLPEYLAGKTWLHRCTPFDLISHAAANHYGFGPIDPEHIKFMWLGESGFSEDDLQEIMECLASPERPGVD